MAKRRAKVSDPAVVRICESCGLPRPVAEYRFHETRQWRADLAWPDYRLIVEIHGGAFAGGRHTRGAGFRGDLKKQNAAVCGGWRVLCFLPEQVGGVEFFEQIATCLALGGWDRSGWRPGTVRVPGM